MKNNKKSLFILLILIALLTFSSCTQINKTPQKKKKALFIYMNGSDLETKHSLASKDIKEILKSAKDDNITIIIETGGTDAWHTKGIDPTINQRFMVKDNKLKLIENLEEKNMGSSKTLSDFINFCLTNYKEEENYLLLWNHGGGAIGGFGRDEKNENSTLLLKELEVALETSYNQTATKLDAIIFDACLMSSIETANIVSPYAKYLVASEELVPSFGFSYLKILNTLNKENNISSLDFLKAFVNSYINESNLKGKSFSIMSIIDLSKIPNLVLEFEKLVLYSENNIKENVFYNIDNLAMLGGKTTTEGFSNMVDLKQLVSKAFLNKNDNFFTALESAVIYKKESSPLRENCGLSLYFPRNNQKNKEMELKIYESISPSANYLEIVKEYFYNYNEEFSLDEYYMENKNYKILALKSYTKSDYRKKVYFNNQILSAYFVEENENYKLYSIPIIYQDKKESLRLTFDKEDKLIDEEILITSSKKYSKEEKTLCLNKEDKIYPILYYKINSSPLKSFTLPTPITINSNLILK